MDRLEFWKTILRHETDTFILIFAVMTLLFGINYVLILRYLSKKNSPIPVEFSIVREKKLSLWFGSTLVSGLFILVSVVLLFLQFQTVTLLQFDVRQELPTANTTGTVRGEYKLFLIDSYINIDGVFYRCSSKVPDTWPEKGKEYEVTYLEHSKIITQLKEK